jgi:hypothetical protein
MEGTTQSKLKSRTGQHVLRQLVLRHCNQLIQYPGVHSRLDTIGRAAFSYDFDSLSGKSHTLAETLDGLTNNEYKRSSFYMRALFWIFPSILSIGRKGEMIKRTKQELGHIASNMWRDAKVVGDSDDRTVMALMCKNGPFNFYTDVYRVRSESR